MNKTPSPIKRSSQLTPLSKEHHEGLLFVWKIRQGLKNGTDVNLIARFVQWFWENDLKAHFQKEEGILVPQLPNEPMLERMVEEHQEIEALLHINEQIADKDLLEKIADAVNDHIRFEERELFPMIEKNLTTEQLDAVLPGLKTGNAVCGKWEEDFWLKK